MKAAVGYMGRKSPDQLGWAITISLVVHAVIISVLTLWPGWHSSRREIFSPSYQVQLVGPPSLPAAGAPVAKAAKRPAPKARAKKPEKIRAKPKPPAKLAEAIATKARAKRKRELERLRREKERREWEKWERQQRLKRLSRERARRAERELNRRLARLQRRVSSERRLNSAISRIQSRAGGSMMGGGAGGASGGKTSLRFQIYYTELWQRIRRHWYLPEAFVGRAKGLVAVVVLRIGRNGRLLKHYLEKGSGNRRFDASAMRAAERAAPYPPLPAGLRAASHEVGVRFRADDLNH